MSALIQPVRGTHDLLPDDFASHEAVIDLASAVAQRYGFRRMDTPIFEFAEVFHRAVGDSSDIVSKETYTFEDRGGERLTLRPEFTAAIVRAVLSNGLQQQLPFKCCYAGPAFRYERPQKGRMRQFHQIGAELLGAQQPPADAEIIALSMRILQALGLSDVVTLELNSLGDAPSRAVYREALVQYFSQHRAALSADSQIRLEKNPLRILDSKDPGDRALIADAPAMAQFYTAEAAEHFAQVQAMLQDFGIAFTHNPSLVRGLDYYSHTVFEITTTQLGAQGTVLAGGRYDGLVELMGGPQVAGIGFAAGVERLVALRALTAADHAGVVPPVKIAIIPFDEISERKAWQIAEVLRGVAVRDARGLAVEMDYKGNAKKRMERANKRACDFVVLLDEADLQAGSVKLKHLASGAQNIFAGEAQIPALFSQSADLYSALEKFCKADA